MSKKHNYILGITWLVAVFVLPLPFLYTFVKGLQPGFESQKLGIANGIIAYVWMLLAIYIGTKPKWIDRLIGLPEAYKLHGILSLVAIVLSFMHKSMSPSYGMIALTGNVAFNIFLALALYSMIFMAGWLTTRITILGLIKRNLEKVFKHEISVWLHRLNLLATVLIFVHVQLIDYIRQNTAFLLVFYLSSIFVFATYLWAKLKPASQGILAQLTANQEIAPNIYELRIQLPKKSRLQLRAGDYVFISFPKIKGLLEPHPFSLVNAPSKTKEIVLAIRGDGDFTRRLQTIEAPTDIFVDGGYGMYQTVIDEQKPKEILVVSGGIGITPLLSLFEANPTLKTTVFHGAETQAALLYSDKFKMFEQRSNFVAHRVVGRYEEKDVLTYLPENLDDVTVLISGPPAMGRYWIKVMKANGVPRGQIFYEEFGW